MNLVKIFCDVVCYLLEEGNHLVTKNGDLYVLVLNCLKSDKMKLRSAVISSLEDSMNYQLRQNELYLY